MALSVAVGRIVMTVRIVQDHCQTPIGAWAEGPGYRHMGYQRRGAIQARSLAVQRAAG